MWEEAYQTACADVGAEVRDDVRTGGSTGEVTVRGNSLDAFHHRLSDTDIEAVVAAVRSCPTVSALHVPYNNIGEAGGVVLGEALGQHSVAFITLDLQHNALGPESGAALAKGLENNDTLSNLLLAGNALGGYCGLALGAALRRNSTLTVLDLYNTDMDVRGLVHVCRALESNRGLVSLNVGRPLLRGPDEVTSVVDHLSVALKTNTTLEEINISHSGITDSDLHTLVVALCTSAVSSLQLKGNKLSEDSGQLLARLLERRHDFKRLDVSCNRLRDKGARDLAKGVGQHPSLASFCMESCTMGEDGLVALVGGLQSCAALRELLLWGNDLTSGVAHALSRSFGDTRRMDHVDFGVEQRDGKWVAFRN